MIAQRASVAMYLCKKFAEEQYIDRSCIFTKSAHSKGPMNSVGAAIINVIDDVAVAMESMTDVSVATSVYVILLLPFHNVVITTYYDDDVDIFNAKIPKQLRISWKNFGTSKVHEVWKSSVQQYSMEESVCWFQFMLSIACHQHKETDTWKAASSEWWNI